MLSTRPLAQLKPRSTTGRREAQIPSGFWTFVAEQIARPLSRDDGDRWRAIGQERLVLGYLLDAASTDRDAITRLIELSESDLFSGPVRAAARRLFHRWQANGAPRTISQPVTPRSTQATNR